MKAYTLIGCPLGHSMSPWIHERLFAMAGREADYTLTEIHPEDLADAVKSTLSGMTGYNITIPHKVGIIPFIDKLDETAERYQSVNCVANRGGQAVGYNTDCVGFCRSVGEIVPGSKVLLIGCGGVGRMMATEAYLCGVELTIVERDLSLAEALASELRGAYPDAGSTVQVCSSAPEDVHFDLLMNACPVGMYPKSNRCPVSDAVVEHANRVFDVIYNPTQTLLMQKARALGKSAVGGSAMLVWQAVRAHEIWDGDSYETTAVEQLIADMEAEVDRLFPAKEEAV